MNVAKEVITNMQTGTPPPRPKPLKGFSEERFVAACRKRKADPLDVLALCISEEGGLPLRMRGDFSARALRYLMAEKKAVEVRAPDGIQVHHQVEVLIVDPANTGSTEVTAAPAPESL